MKKFYFILLAAVSGLKVSAQTATIPVVFHVVYKIAAQNIPDSCLQQQLDVLNEDFNAANPDLWKVPSAWVPIIGNMNVNFVLASTDPSGNSTTGIERYQTTVTSFGTNNAVCYNAQGGMDAWPDTSYLNIWVCNLGSGLLGYTQFPGGPAATDGVVLHYRNVGRGSYCWSPYNLGRTGTHEVAHWFGLKNFAPQQNCSTDGDQIPDTPTYDDNMIFGGYAPFTVLTDSCNLTAPGIMWMNFMTFVDDSSMYFFTQDQIDTMTWVMNNMRQGVVMTDVNAAVKTDQLIIYPSPSSNGIFTVEHTAGQAIISVYNMLGETVATLKTTGKKSTLDLSMLPDGYYTVVLAGEEKTETRKIVIAR